jgi:predicted lipoprotein with Yx(FWY)xxD motif
MRGRAIASMRDGGIEACRKGLPADYAAGGPGLKPERCVRGRSSIQSRRTIMRGQGWTAAGLIAAALLAVTACGHGSSGSNGAGGAYGGAYGSSQPSAPAAGGAATAKTTSLKTEATGAGTVLASSQGMTLYYYGEDKPGSGTSACTGSCASYWPPLTAPVTAPAGVHMPGPIGTITRANGIKQVTINGYPIYTYSGDKAPGQASGNGVQGEWHVIKMPSTQSSQAGNGGYGY